MKDGKKQTFMSSVKTISHSIREYKKPSLLTPLFMLGEVVFECLIPYVMSLLLEKIYSDDLLLEILKYGGILILLAMCSLFCGFMSGKLCATASSGFAKNLRKDLYYKLQGFSFSNIDKFSNSSLVTRLTTDITNVQMAYMMIIRIAVRAPLMLIFSLTMSFIINAQMALIFLATAPILAIGLTLIMVKAIPFFHRIFPKYDALNESVNENIRGMRVVKSYVREDYEKKKFNKASDEVRSSFTKAEKIVALNTPLMNFCVYAGLIAIYVVGSILIIDSREAVMKLTQLQSFMSYSFQILMSLMMFSMIMVMIVISMASAKRIAEVLQEKSDITSPENAVTEVIDGSIEFKDVSFKYSEKAEKYALSNINLKIRSGQTIGILGSTGSSKSTLVQLIPRLYDVNEGAVEVGGVNVKDYDLDALRNSVAMVLQKNVLFSGPVRDNMKWGNKDATDEEIMKCMEMAQISSINLDKVIDQGGANVSGGQKQRLCIARALLKNPKIIIFDDSTSAVDTKTDALIRKALKEYTPETTKIIIAQRVASVMESDRILIMENGTITAMGTHEQLLAENEIYQELYYSQNNVSNENVTSAKEAE